jgi:putative ABC transport system substrate-binding protein
MNRRDLITLLGGAAAWPVAARAQQPTTPVVGFLNSDSPLAERVGAFRQGLSETGYIEGQNVAIESRWAEGQYDRLPMLAADLARRQVAAIAVISTPAALAAKRATAAIPIVFGIADDPVESGLVASLNRPGGNLTGLTALNAEVGPKRLELLHELVPMATIMALLVNPTNPNAEALSKDAQAAARTLGLQIQVLHASTEHELDTAFANLVPLRAGALLIGTDPFFTSRSEELAARALGQAVPTIFQYRTFAAAGGLLSYAGSFTEGYRLVGVYTGRILKGDKPADLPVQRVTKVELIINLKTAKALGLTVPLALLTRADEVIE